MRSIVRKVDKKWFRLMVLDKLNRMICKIIDDESLTSYNLSVVIENWIKVVPPMPTTKPVVLVESARIRMIGRLHSVVPFPKRCCCITRRLERLCDRRFVEIQSLATGSSRKNASAGMISPREKFCPRWRADGTNEKLTNKRSISRQPVNVWSVLNPDFPYS